MTKDKVKTKSKGKNILWLLSLLLICTCVTGYYFLVQYPQIRASEQALAEAEMRLDSEKEKTRQLQQQQEALSSEEYIEDIARSELNLLKPNEKVFIDIAKNR